MSQQAERHEAIGKQIASTYPLIHERTLALYLQYLEHKCQWGKWEELLYIRYMMKFQSSCQATLWSCPSIKISLYVTLCSVC